MAIAKAMAMTRHATSLFISLSVAAACGPAESPEHLAEATDAVVVWTADACNSTNDINVTWNGDVSLTVPIRSASHFGLGSSAGAKLLARLTAREARQAMLEQLVFQQGLASFTCPGCESGDGCEQGVGMPQVLPASAQLSLTLGYGAHDCRDDGALDRHCTIIDERSQTVTVFGEAAMSMRVAVGCTACAWPKGCAYGSAECRRHPARALPDYARLSTEGGIAEIRAEPAADDE